MNFKNGGRLVLTGPTNETFARWELDDPDCLSGNCVLADYFYYINLFDPDNPQTVGCDDESYPIEAYIAAVDTFGVELQRFGSYGVNCKSGEISGYLVHTPVISPVIFGTLHSKN